MASRTVTELVDDITGEPIRDGHGETVRFALDGIDYEMDLSEDNAAKLREELTPWVERGRRLAGRKTTGPRRVGRSYGEGCDPKAVRVWAAANKVTVPARGRIPHAVLEQYPAVGG